MDIGTPYGIFTGSCQVKARVLMMGRGKSMTKRNINKDSKVSLYDPVSNYPSSMIFSIIFHAVINSVLS